MSSDERWDRERDRSRERVEEPERLEDEQEHILGIIKCEEEIERYFADLSRLKKPMKYSGIESRVVSLRTS